MLCMLPEKEDKQAFEQKVNNTKAAQAAQRAREEAQRRAAIEAHNRPASPQEQAQARLHCEQTIRGPARDAGMAYCLAAWKANPHARCAAGNLPCGTVDEGLCYNPYANQRCVNGQTISVNSSFPPWAEAFLSGKIALPNGRYVFASASCDSAPPNAVIILQDSTLRYGRTLFNLVNAGGPQSFTAMTTGDGHNGTIGYNEDVTVNDATSFTLSGFGMANLGRYRLCAPSPNIHRDKIAEQPAIPPLVVYPHLGQREEQQSRDRFDCHQWAVRQTGCDPTQRCSPEQVEQVSSYHRAMCACLEGRGYSCINNK